MNHGCVRKCLCVCVWGGLRHIKICNQMMIMIKWRRLDDFAVFRQNLCASWRSPPHQGWPLEDASTTVLAMSPMASRHGPMEMVAYGCIWIVDSCAISLPSQVTNSHPNSQLLVEKTLKLYRLPRCDTVKTISSALQNTTSIALSSGPLACRGFFRP